MAVRLNRQVKAELDDIWLYIAVESSSLKIADRVVETITDTFLQLSKHPAINYLTPPRDRADYSSSGGARCK